MYCSHCGKPNDDFATKCTSCGAAIQPIAPRKIDNNLALAIVVTVLCCLPFGIVAIVYASQVNTKAVRGDFAAAEESARKARAWSLWGLGLGFVGYGLYVAMVVIGILTGNTPR